VHCGARPVGGWELSQQVPHVVLDGLLSDAKACTDFSVAQSERHLLEHLELAVRQDRANRQGNQSMTLLIVSPARRAGLWWSPEGLLFGQGWDALQKKAVTSPRISDRRYAGRHRLHRDLSTDPPLRVGAVDRR
jgi:hypothetical protein